MIMATQNEHGPNRDQTVDVLKLVARQARAYLDSLHTRPARAAEAESAASRLQGSLPETGGGAVRTHRLLAENAADASVAPAGPRCFHFVIGGTTPAALGGDALAAAPRPSCR
jgi:hypothetical protein